MCSCGLTVPIAPPAPAQPVPPQVPPLQPSPQQAPACAQDQPDIGLKSVGRGRPLAASVNDLPAVGPGWVGGGFQVSSDQKLDGFRPGELPAGIEPLPVDIFTSKDFYADKALWSDPRYFRCNSPMATEIQRGILSPNPLITTGNVPTT